MVLKVAIAGFGTVGQRRFNFLKKKKNFKVISISDQFSEYKKKFKSGTVYSDYRKMLKRERIDVLFVCLPNKESAKATILGLKNNCNVFCEKPPSKNLKELKAVNKVFKQKKNLILRYGFNHRYHDSVQYAQKIIKSGKLGKIINLRGVYGKSYIVLKTNYSKKQNYRFNWRTRKKDSGGGILLDQGIHLVDLLNLFVGNFIESKSYISKSYWKKDVEDNVYTILKNKNKIFATLHSSATLWKHNFLLDITLEKGMINLSGILSGTKSYGKEKITIIQRTKNDLKPKEKTNFYTKDLSWDKEIDDFIKLIKSKPKKYQGGISEAIETMKIIEMIYSSAS